MRSQALRRRASAGSTTGMAMPAARRARDPRTRPTVAGAAPRQPQAGVGRAAAAGSGPLPMPSGRGWSSRSSSRRRSSSSSSSDTRRGGRSRRRAALPRRCRPRCRSCLRWRSRRRSRRGTLRPSRRASHPRHASTTSATAARHGAWPRMHCCHECLHGAVETQPLPIPPLFLPLVSTPA